MSILDQYIKNIYSVIVDKEPLSNQTLVKVHTKFFEDLGDMSFPLFRKNWLTIIGKSENDDDQNILKYRLKETDNVEGLNKLKHILNQTLSIREFKIIKHHAHLYLDRTILIETNLRTVLLQKCSYGKTVLFDKLIKVVIDEKVDNENINEVNLSVLRLLIIKNVAENLLNLTTNLKEGSTVVYMSLNRTWNKPHIICGPVINEDGVKNTRNLAADVFNKRASDMRMMAQHRYRVYVKPNTGYVEYFYKLGVSSVTIELLSNKPHKSIKVLVNGVANVNKGPSFIFYNCARLSTLLNEFDRKVEKGIYPKLPDIQEINLHLLNQPEEWELFFGYILQFPFIVRNCIRDIEKGILNTQNLITYLSNLSSIFSIYYRRVRILTDPREHLFMLIHCRIYLLKALQYVFHNALRILNIDPIEEM